MEEEVRQALADSKSTTRQVKLECMEEESPRDQAAFDRLMDTWSSDKDAHLRTRAEEDRVIHNFLNSYGRGTGDFSKRKANSREEEDEIIHTLLTRPLLRSPSGRRAPVSPMGSRPMPAWKESAKRCSRRHTSRRALERVQVWAIHQLIRLERTNPNKVAGGEGGQITVKSYRPIPSRV